MATPEPNPSSASFVPATRVGIVLAVVQVLFYAAFIGLATFNPSLMARPIVPGATATIAIVFGISVIASTIVLTGLYVLIANSTATDATN